MSFRYAICNETFEGWDHARVCRFVAGLGYTGDTSPRAGAGFADAGVRLCLEPLAPSEADFINSAAEAVAILDRLAHPSFALHLDVKAMAADGPAPELIRQYASRTGHFHAN